MDALKTIVIIYLIVGMVYATYNYSRKMDPLSKVPVNVLFGPAFILYILWITFTKRKPRIG